MYDVFTICIRTEIKITRMFVPFGPHGMPVFSELTLGHLRYHLTNVPPQPNSPPDYVSRTDQPSKKTTFNQMNQTTSNGMSMDVS